MFWKTIWEVIWSTNLKTKEASLYMRLPIGEAITFTSNQLKLLFFRYTFHTIKHSFETFSTLGFPDFSSSSLEGPSKSFASSSPSLLFNIGTLQSSVLCHLLFSSYSKWSHPMLWLFTNNSQINFANSNLHLEI